jgi:hypothetical protein
LAATFSKALAFKPQVGAGPEVFRKLEPNFFHPRAPVQGNFDPFFTAYFIYSQIQDVGESEVRVGVGG